MSRYEADKKKNPDDFWIDEVGDVFNSAAKSVSDEPVGLFRKGTIGQKGCTDHQSL